MWPDLVSNPGPLTYESGALPTALRGPAMDVVNHKNEYRVLPKRKRKPHIKTTLF